MTPLIFVLAALTLSTSSYPADAQRPPGTASSDVLYRCETADSIIIQSTQCPKGATQRKIAIQRPSETADIAPQAQAPATPTAPVTVVAHPVAAASVIRGPNQPYPLWECMRGDGSTFDSRDSAPGKLWVVNPNTPGNSAENVPPAATPAQSIAASHLHDHIVRSYNSVETVDNTPAAPTPDPPPAGAAPGQWVTDQCTQLTPQQACERFAVRRNALRKQIYAAKPSERSNWAPEEQDLSSMLYAACGR